MRGSHGDKNRMLERREVAALAELELLFEVAGKIVMPRKLNRWAKRRVGLYENFAGCFSATGASSHLSEQLKSAFTSAEIRQMQCEIGVDDSNQCDIRKMQTFRDHLRADEDVDFPGAKGEQCFAIRVFARHRIGVHPPNHCARKKLRHIGFDFLGA